MRSLASIRRAAPSLAPVLLATVSQVALAQGFDKVNTTVTNINTILVTISIAVVTIAIIWAGFKMIFQGARLADVANVLIGGGNKQISLQPVSVEGNVGLNVAAGLAEVTLKAAK